MRYTNKRGFNRRKRRGKARRFAVGMVIVMLLCVCGGLGLTMNHREYVLAYEEQFCGKELTVHPLVTDDFCVANQDVPNEFFKESGSMYATGLFDIDAKQVAYAKDIHKRVYPASTTKLLTAYVAIKHGNLDDVVTVSENAVGVPWDSSRAGLCTGDKLDLKSLIYGLMLPSGNDCGVAIAEHISGSEEAFVELMNTEACQLGATNTHFVNSHGYHHQEHYTTAYDLYLIMNACATQEVLMEVLSSSSYDVRIDQANGTYRDTTWHQTNQYILGLQDIPNGVTVVGGKTGTTNEAGACLVLYEKTEDGKPYISIVMGAEDKIQLYHNMTGLLSVMSR